MTLRATLSRRRDRRGFTLFELLLVLGLMVLIGAIVVPSFSRTFENQRLRESADIVRTALARARIEAMKSGRTMLFRYEMGGNHYIMEPWVGADDYIEMGDISIGTIGPTLPSIDEQLNTNPQGNRTSLAVFGRTHELPEGISFHSAAQDLSVRDMVTQQQLGADTMLSSEAQWSPPVLFYPDGSASQSVVRLVNSELNRFVLVRLRGLTGIASVTDIRTLHELDFSIQ